MAEDLELLGVEELARKLKQINNQTNRLENSALRGGAKIIHEEVVRRAREATARAVRTENQTNGEPDATLPTFSRSGMYGASKAARRFMRDCLKGIPLKRFTSSSTNGGRLSCRHSHLWSLPRWRKSKPPSPKSLES